MFNAYKRFFAFAGKQKKTWYKGMGYELLRSIFEAIQFIALLVVLRALVEQNVTGETALAALGVMLVSVTGAAVFWYLAHNSEGQANYHMCEEKRIRIGERMKYMPMGYFNHVQSIRRKLNLGKDSSIRLRCIRDVGYSLETK